MKSKKYYVYILSSKHNNVLYIGVTGNISQRTYQHQEKQDGFTKKYNITKLVRVEEFDSSEAAIIREKQLKKWHRKWKIRLIEQDNPTWEEFLQLNSLSDNPVCHRIT